MLTKFHKNRSSRFGGVRGNEHCDTRILYIRRFSLYHPKKRPLFLVIVYIATCSVIAQLKQSLRELESRGNDSLAVYGNNMVELCQEINAAVAKKQFSQKPRGPIGMYPCRKCGG